MFVKFVLINNRGYYLFKIWIVLLPLHVFILLDCIKGVYIFVECSIALLVLNLFCPCLNFAVVAKFILPVMWLKMTCSSCFALLSLCSIWTLCHFLNFINYEELMIFFFLCCCSIEHHFLYLCLRTEEFASFCLILELVIIFLLFLWVDGGRGSEQLVLVLNCDMTLFWNLFC